MTQSRLAAWTASRQIDALVRADDAAAAAERAVTRAWRQLVTLMQQPMDPYTAYHTSRQILHTLLPEITQTIAGSFREMAAWSHRTGALTLVRETPLPLLLTTVARRQGRPVTEAVVMGQDESGQWVWSEEPPTAFPVTAMPDARARSWILDWLFPPLTRRQTDSIVFAPFAGVTWMDRLAASTSLAAPEQVASTIAAGYAAGRTRQQLVQDLLPVVQGVQSSAARIARTEGMRIAHETLMRQHEALGNLVVGYQIHATLDEHTRPEHAARNGTIYYRHPMAGQLGYDRMPHPPQEADGSTAHNCRCWLAPVLAPPAAAKRDPSYEPTLAKTVVPDPVIYSQWFDNTSEHKQRLAVGARRYNVARDVAGGKPTWSVFLNPATGGLLSTEQLRTETPAARRLRLRQVEAMLAHREQALRRVRAFGYERR